MSRHEAFIISNWLRTTRCNDFSHESLECEASRGCYCDKDAEELAAILEEDRAKRSVGIRNLED